MSKPETQCLPTCLWRESAATLGHWIIVRHAEGCGNPKNAGVLMQDPGLMRTWIHAEGCPKHAPKAEAPPCDCFDRIMDDGFRATTHRVKCPDNPLTRDQVTPSKEYAAAPPAPKCDCPQTPAPFPRTAHGEDCPERPNRLTVDAQPAPKSAAYCRAMESHVCMKPATPAPVSEPPKWMAEARDMAFEELNRAFLAMKAQNAALQNAHDHAQDGLKSARKQEGEMREKIATLTERVQAAERDSSASMELYRSAVARRDDAEAKVATLTAERDTFYMDYRLKCDAETKALTVELERLRDLIVRWEDQNRNDELMDEARAIRAAREAGKS